MPLYELQHSTDGLSKLIAAETEKRADPWHYCLREFQGEIFNGIVSRILASRQGMRSVGWPAPGSEDRLLPSQSGAGQDALPLPRWQIDKSEDAGGRRQST
jgi:hypothetical protein